jgi:hypothetical protein
MQRDGKRKWFVMPPAEEAVIEPTAPVDVYAVLRDHMKYVELIHTELRHARHDKQELQMKVSELSSKVDTLISVATDLKGRVDASGASAPSAGTPAANIPAEDDPEVERLAHRIDDAVAVLRGEKSVDQPTVTPPAPAATEPPVNQFDPNSPVPAQPSPEALATDINSPQAANPNAPV